MRKVNRRLSPMNARFHVGSLFTTALVAGWLIAGCASSDINSTISGESKTTKNVSSNTSTSNSKAVSSNPSRYPIKVVQTFMDACVKSGGTQGNCACTIDKIQNRYSLEEFGKVEAEAQKTGNLPNEILEFIQSCRTAS